MVKPIIRDVGMIILGVCGAIVGYLGLTGELPSNPLLGLGLILIALIFAYSLGERVSTRQGEHVRARRS